MGYHLTSTQFFEKVLGAFEGFHLDISGADFPKGMGIGAGACRDPEGASQLLGSPVELGLRTPVEYLHDVNLSGDTLDRLFPQVASARVVRVFQVNQCSLVLDSVDRSFWGQPAENPPLEKEADEFSLGRHDLLADDDREASFEELLCPFDPIVIGQHDGGEPDLPAATSDLEGRHSAVKRSRAMEMEINPDDGGVCTDRHIRYYKRRRRALSRGEAAGLPRGVAID